MAYTDSWQSPTGGAGGDDPAFTADPSMRAREPVSASRAATSIVIADHHPLVLEGLFHVLSREVDLDVVERCSSGDGLLAAMLRHRPRLAIADMHVPAPDALAVLRAARQAGLDTAVILMSGSLHDDEILEAVRLGIRGLVAKNAPVETLLKCVRTVLAGDTCLDQALVGRAMATLLTREAALRELSAVLTARELEVVRMVTTALRNREIAERLFISEGTIKVHLHHIFEKLGVASRHDLIAYVRKLGLV